jgi:hypothetical protein
VLDPEWPIREADIAGGAICGRALIGHYGSMSKLALGYVLVVLAVLLWAGTLSSDASHRTWANESAPQFLLGLGQVVDQKR